MHLWHWKKWVGIFLIIGSMGTGTVAAAAMDGRCEYACKDGAKFLSGLGVNGAPINACDTNKPDQLLLDCSVSECNEGCSLHGGCDMNAVACAAFQGKVVEKGCTAGASEEAVYALEQTSKTQRSSWTCQKTDDFGPQLCVDPSACGQGEQCCVPPGASPVPKTQPGGGGSGGGGGGGAPAGGFAMDSCTTSGECGLDEIVKTGVNFAKYLFGLSGAIFLAIFIYGGLRYLVSGGGEDYKKAKDMMVKATIGIIIIFMANTAVRFIYSSLVSPVAKTQTTCDKMYSRQGYVCRTLSGKEEAAQLGCLIDSKGGNKQLCGTDVSVYCCNIDPADAQTLPKK